jgi:hypothetical protein
METQPTQWTLRGAVTEQQAGILSRGHEHGTTPDTVDVVRSSYSNSSTGHEYGTTPDTVDIVRSSYSNSSAVY